MRNINTDIWNIINSLEPSLLKGKGIYFGGGTLISILHNEYRVSTDIDLFCSNHEAFLNIRNHLRKNSMESLFTKTLPISAHRIYDTKITLFVQKIDHERDTKIEILYNDLLSIKGCSWKNIPIQSLTVDELFTAKLLSNTNRFATPDNLNKDIVDLGMLLYSHKDRISFPWDSAYKKFGKEDVDKSFVSAVKILQRDDQQLRTKDLLNISDSDFQNIISSVNAKTVEIDINFIPIEDQDDNPWMCVNP